ncbi:MAG: hypothetical protein AAGG44_04030 [Planctomycetota bacterium]
MAVRDRNMFAWQAYVITMAFVSVGLLLGMFFLWRSYSDLSTRFADSETAKQTAQGEYTTSQRRVARLLSMMGKGSYTEADLQQMSEEFKNDAELAPIEADFEEAMKLFPPNQPANEKNLVELPKFLIDNIRIRNQQIESARARELQLQAELAATVDRETKAREDAVTKQKAAESDLATARQEHTASINRLNAEKDEAVAKFSAYRQSMDKKLDAARANIISLTAERDKLQATNDELSERVQQFIDPDFAAPQGSIVRVADGGTKLWIDLGSADGLRAGVPFSVIDEADINISKATPKAKITVLKVVDKHLAYAQLEENLDFRNPVVTGDKIYSPAWRPGRKVGFALVGMMDINGDRRDDIAQVRELIRLSGGVIDEEMDSKNTRTGPGMSPQTQFLVLGTDLEISENASADVRAQQQAKAKQYQDFLREARQNGIIQISLEKLMGYLKSDNSDRTVPLGRRIQGQNFQQRALTTPPVSRGTTSFTPRSRQN